MRYKRFITILVILSLLCQNSVLLYGQDKLAKDSFIDDTGFLAESGGLARFIAERRGTDELRQWYESNRDRLPDAARLVFEKLFAVLTSRRVYLAGRKEFHLPYELVGRVIVETGERKEWVRLEDRNNSGNWLKVLKRGEEFFIAMPGVEEKLAVDKRSTGFVYNDVMAEFVGRVIQSEYNPRNRAEAIREYLEKEGVMKPGYGEVDMGRTRIILSEFYDKNRGAISIYRDRGQISRYAVIADNADPKNYIILERRGADVYLVVRNRIIKLYAENDFIYLTRIRKFKEFDLKIPRPVKSDLVKGSGLAASGHTTFTFNLQRPMLVERREGTTHRKEEWVRDKITFKNEETGSVIAEIERIGVDRFILTGDGRSVVIIGNHLYLNGIIWDFQDLTGGLLREYFNPPLTDRGNITTCRRFADNVLIREGYPYTDIPLDAEARYDLYKDLSEDTPAVARLRDREKEILKLRLGSDTISGLTLEEIGRIKGVTRERIRQIEARAIRKWKKAMGNTAVGTAGMYTPDQHRKTNERIRSVVSGLTGVRVQEAVDSAGLFATGGAFCERLPEVYRGLIEREMLGRIISTGRLPDSWPVLGELVKGAEYAGLIREIGNAVEEAARGTGLDIETKAIVIEAITVRFIDELTKVLDRTGFGLFRDEIVGKVLEIRRRRIDKTLSTVDYYFLLGLEKLLGFPAGRLSFKVHMSELKGKADSRTQELRDIFELNLEQWHFLEPARDKNPAGIIVQDIRDLGPGVQNWMEGLKRYNVDISGIKMVYVTGGISAEEKQRLFETKPSDVVLVNSADEVKGENVVYLGSGFKDSAIPGISYIEREFGPVLDLTRCLLLLETGDDSAFMEKIGRLPKIDKILRMWDELQKEGSYLDTWA